MRVQTQSVWNYKTGIYWRLLRFAVEQIHGEVARSYDWTALKKDGKYVPSYRTDLPKDLQDYLDFIGGYDEVFKDVSSNIGIASNRESKPSRFAMHTDTLNEHNELSPREATAADEEILTNYDKRLAENPDDVTEMAKISLLKELGRYEEIMKTYDERVENEPDSEYYMTCKGELLEQLGRDEDAIRYYDEMIANNLDCHKNKGDREDGTYDGDMPIIEPLYTLMGNKAELLERLGRYEEAIECYKERYETDPDNESYLTYKGNLLEKLGRYEDAIKCYDEIGAFPYGNSEMLFRKAYLLHHMSRYKESLECFESDTDEGFLMMQIDVLYREHRLYLKGLFLTKIGRYDDAIKCYNETMVQVDGIEAVTVLAAKGDVFAHIGRHEEALECYDEALKINRDKGHLLYGYGVAYDRVDALSRKISSLYCLGRHDEAVECYNMIISGETHAFTDWIRRPTYISMGIKFAKGLYLDEIGRHDEAVKYHELVSSRKP